MIIYYSTAWHEGSFDISCEISNIEEECKKFTLDLYNKDPEQFDYPDEEYISFYSDSEMKNEIAKFLMMQSCDFLKLPEFSIFWYICNEEENEFMTNTDSE